MDNVWVVATHLNSRTQFCRISTHDAPVLHCRPHDAALRQVRKTRGLTDWRSGDVLGLRSGDGRFDARATHFGVPPLIAARRRSQEVGHAGDFPLLSQQIDQTGTLLYVETRAGLAYRSYAARRVPICWQRLEAVSRLTLLSSRAICSCLRKRTVLLRKLILYMHDITPSAVVILKNY
jgi:hypothetical protein